MSEWQAAVTHDGRDDQPALLEQDFGWFNTLQHLDGADHFAVCAWHYPAGQDFEDVVPNSDDYLQAGGSAERMTLELRQTDASGEYTHWVLGREPLGASPTEPIGWHGFSTKVHPGEVWTAEDAAVVFEEFAAHRDIPPTVHRRVLEI